QLADNGGRLPAEHIRRKALDRITRLNEFAALLRRQKRTTGHDVLRSLEWQNNQRKEMALREAVDRRCERIEDAAGIIIAAILSGLQKTLPRFRPSEQSIDSLCAGTARMIR